MEIQNYTSKSFILVGQKTRLYKEDIKKVLGGKWNSRLKSTSGERFGAWIFPISKRNKVEMFLEKIYDSESRRTALPVSEIETEGKPPVELRGEHRFCTACLKYLPSPPKVSDSAEIIKLKKNIIRYEELIHKELNKYKKLKNFIMAYKPLHDSEVSMPLHDSEVSMPLHDSEVSMPKRLLRR